MKVPFTFFFCFYILGSHAQKEANNWYFGQAAGVTFNHGQAKTLTNNKDGTDEGCASISNGAGQFLLYSNGANLYDSTFTVTPTGSKLKGASTATQSALFVPKGDSTGKYFLITNNGTTFTLDGGLYYSEIDMSLNSGKGDVVAIKKNILICDSTLEKFSVVKHANGKDYWLVVPKSETDIIRSFLITNSGISSNPVISKSGTLIRYYEAVGQMKISINGRKLAYSNTNNKGTIVADFDAASGKATNFWNLSKSRYGLEFSPSGQYLYLLGTTLLQYDLNVNSEKQFIDSETEIDARSASVSMQLGPDGKIYFVLKDSLQVIHFPDSSGKKCKFQSNYLSLQGRAGNKGLPGFVNHWLWRNKIIFSHNCLNDSALFHATIRSDYDSLLWDFGDKNSGIRNYSRQGSEAFHIFNKVGNYKVKLFIFYKGFTDSILIQVPIKNVKPFIGNDTIYCNSFSADIYSKRHYLNYKWNTGSGSEFLLAKAPGIYILNAQDSLLCWVSDTIEIKNPLVKAYFKISDTGVCLKNNVFYLKDSSVFKNDKKGSVTWHFFNGNKIQDSTAKISFPTQGEYDITFIAESQLGCRDTLIKKIKVYPQDPPNFSINKQTQCFKNHSFDYTNTTIATGNNKYLWQLGDLSENTLTNIIDKKYANEGDYLVKLISISPYFCQDTVVKSIKILPSPSAKFTVNVACKDKKTEFKYTGSKPIEFFKWKFDKTDSSELENPTIIFKSAGQKTISCMVESANKCRDTFFGSLDVKWSAKANFTPKDACEGDSAQFKNHSINADEFLWKFGDGYSSSLFEPKHLYEIKGISKTFNTTLIAKVKDGCADSMNSPITVNAIPNSNFTYITNTARSYSFKADQPGNTAYRWLFGDGDSAVAPNVTHVYAEAPKGIKVCLKIVNASSCISETCKEVGLTSLPHFVVISYWGVAPNPNHGVFTIINNHSMDGFDMEIFNLVGQKVEIYSGLKSGDTIQSNLQKGIYLLYIKMAEGSFFKKIEIL